MKWEQRLAVVLVVLVFALLARNLWFPVQVGDVSVVNPRSTPAIIEEGEAYYPVYFPAKDGGLLIPEFQQGQATVEGVLATLESGPKVESLVSGLPLGTKILSYTQQGSLLFVNLSEHFVTNQSGGSRAEIFSIYCIVNSLIGVGEIDKVQILVNSERIATIAGHLLVNEPLNKDYGILGAWGN